LKRKSFNLPIGSNNGDRKLATFVDIVDIIPPNTDKNTILKADDVLAGTTKLSQEDLHQLFQHRNLAYLATLSKDGSPHVIPVWAELVDDLILINTFESSVKNRNIMNDKRIALSIVGQNNPFNMVSIKGRVIEQVTEGADEHLKKLAKKYLGIGRYYYRKPSHKRIILKIKPEKIMGLSIHPAFYFLGYSPWNK
jgi:PPOX class probable F420-dependent enzyme